MADVLVLVKSTAAIWWEAKKTPSHPSRLMGRMATRSPRMLSPD
jgi:hypothetical protein